MSKKLTHKELLYQLEYNLLTGYFYWKIDKKSIIDIIEGNIAGSLNKSTGYIEIGIQGKTYYGHRLAWFYVHGYWPENIIDHKDKIKHHNWINNLREVSKSCNLRNTGNPKNNTSGIKGISWNEINKKWIAQITVQSKNKYLGSYLDFADAVCARFAVEQCLKWEGCDSNSPAFQYVKKNIQCQMK